MMTTKARKQVFTIGIAWISAALLALTAALPAMSQEVDASVGSGSNLARIAIEFEDGAAFLFGVYFDEPTTGLDAMLTLDAELPSFSLVLIDFGPFGLVIDGVRYKNHSNGEFGQGERFWHYWIRPDDLDSAALPTLMRKVVRHALDAGDSAVRGKSTGIGA